MEKSGLVFESVEGETVVHVWPWDDLIGHEMGFDCVCGPDKEYYASENKWIMIHHSLDGREEYE